MNQELQLIQSTRKQRITKERNKLSKKRKTKVAGYALASTVAAGALFSGGKALEVSATEQLYTVKKGDTLYSLGKKYNVSIDQLKNVNGLDSNRIYTGAQITVPGEKAATYKRVTVKKGDTLYRIAQQHGLTVTTIKEANSLSSDLIQVGEKLYVPLHADEFKQVGNSLEDSNGIYDVEKGDTLYSIAQQFNVSVKVLKNMNGLTNDRIFVGEKILVPSVTKASIEDPSAKEEKRTVYQVAQGDTLYRIAKNHGVSVKEIKEVNGDTIHANIIYPGQTIYLPPMEVEDVELEEKSVDRAIYTVAPGETLWSVASRLNLTVEELKTMNDMEDDFILIGQDLVIESSNLVSTEAVLKGAVDRSSVEFELHGQYLVLDVPFGMSEKFDKLTDEKVTIIYQDKRKPTLVSIDV
ncbi:LysM peptidoglycan-binding domain-containing protein [Salipaludibacillus daqingensis]|uniref:LysM peptidoglycan-binding domain-containing protein n=1 Tax=Salipaludibacillus daqingensis TaxID=3041001 RepID=UPI002475A8CA|nr:LysM peptidoglycan-binding domain-containing protein [Salipaludibacillus daqingensis]